MLKNKVTKRKVTKEQTEEDPEQSIAIRRRAHTISNEPRPKGRPVGAKTNKGKPQLDHSTVVERTRSKRPVTTTSKYNKNVRPNATNTEIHEKTWAPADKEKMLSKRVQELKNYEAELSTDDSSTKPIEETQQRKRLTNQNYQSVTSTSGIEIVVNKNANEDEKRKSNRPKATSPKLHWRVQEILNRLDRESQSSIMSDTEPDVSELRPSSSRRFVMSSTGVEDRDAKEAHDSTDNRAPIEDPRYSGLRRGKDTEIEASEDQESQTKSPKINKSSRTTTEEVLSETTEELIEIPITGPQTSASSEKPEDEISKENADSAGRGDDDNLEKGPKTSLTPDEVWTSVEKFEASLCRHRSLVNVSHFWDDLGLAQDNKTIEMPSHFSDGDEPPPEIQETL
ncbi:uncharacterized protein LOC131675632 [Phymastichus coffea]|uniref:uncharacterized protein LOC131675632 n=1 Tax=Phymastichus coffea TaxID=108790 RepID=UPI00273C3963|nr:uncharacterized protein LOC131675632 [Phymastichus coffea]